MSMFKALTALAFGSVLLAGCGADKDESAAQTDTPSPAAETPGTLPDDTTDPAMSDTLPTAEEPPPTEPSPPSR